MEGQDAMLIDVGANGEIRNNLDTASGGGVPQPVGFIGFPQPPLLPNPTPNFIVSNTCSFRYFVFMGICLLYYTMYYLDFITYRGKFNCNLFV